MSEIQFVLARDMAKRGDLAQARQLLLDAKASCCGLYSQRRADELLEENE